MNSERPAKTKNEIVTDIKFYIANEGGRYPDWYVGVSKDAKDRMFNGHKVDQKKDLWIYRKAASAAVAREVVDHLVNMLGFDGAPGGGDDTAARCTPTRRALIRSREAKRRWLLAYHARINSCIL